MKPLKLVISAFGSYLERTEIDFSLLGDSGIYLITGDTGAGKSTIFEAISYALYGETVSGADRNASMLRNTAASDDLETYVELDFQEKGKNYHIRRSPKYSLERLKKTRKKKDSTEEPKTQAEHSNEFLLEEPGGSLLITKEKDGDQLITEIVGIGKENFKKIAMIAQGDFMKVIREKTEAREKILNSVFDTQNYVLLTDKLKSFRADAKNEMDILTSRLLSCIHQIRFQEDSAYGQQAAALTELSYLSTVRIDEAVEVIGQLSEEDQQLLEGIGKELTEKTTRAGQVKIQLGKAQERSRLKAALKIKLQEEKVLSEKLPELEKRFADVGDNPQQAETLGKAAEVIRAGLGEYDILDRAVKAAAESEKQLTALEKEFTIAKTAKETAEKNEMADRKRLAELEGIESKKADLDSSYQQIVTKGKAMKGIHDKLTAIVKKQSEDLKEKEQSFLDAKEDYDQKKTVYDRTYEGFINNQAGILAETLRTGRPCPVCGSLEHPSPAKPEKAVDKQQLDKAKKELDKSDKALQNASAALGTEKTLIASMLEDLKKMLVQDTDIVFTTLAETGEQVSQQLNQQRKEVSGIIGQRKTINALLEEKEKVKKHREQCLEDISKYSTMVTELNGRYHSLQEKLNGDKSKAEELREKLEFSSRQSAQTRIQELTVKAAELKAVFDAARKGLEEQKNKLSDCRSAEDALKKQLDEGEDADIGILDMEDKTLTADLNRLNDTKQAVNERLRWNRQMLDTLSGERDTYAKKSEYYHRCDDLYRTAGGDLKGRDSIKLLSYVQAAYFERILQRANIRLLAMSGGKYSLVRSQIASDKRKNTGLDIDVRENRSSKCRRVDTLSGGESFMAALSMALGLSDEIQSGSGGIRLETMFIDEGFGSLDEKALDKAIEALNTLSTGNTLIGIISHVSKLKEIITRRINVTKDNEGVTHAKVEL